jgi:hypothetical protein
MDSTVRLDGNIEFTSQMMGEADDQMMTAVSGEAVFDVYSCQLHMSNNRSSRVNFRPSVLRNSSLVKGIGYIQKDKRTPISQLISNQLRAHV